MRTTHEISQLVSSMYKTAEMECSSTTEHKDMSQTEVQRSNNSTTRVIEALNGFLNPFSVECDGKLLIISSGQAATNEIEHDVIHAEKYGTLARDELINSRLRTNSNFFELD